MRLHAKLVSKVSDIDFKGPDGSWVLTGATLTVDGTVPLAGDATLAVVVPDQLTSLADMIIYPFGYDHLTGEAELVDGAYHFTSLDDGGADASDEDDSELVATLTHLMTPVIAEQVVQAPPPRHVPSWPAQFMPRQAA